MSGADDLLIATSADLRDHATALLADALPNIKDADLDRAWQALERALFPDPANARAILNLIGDVREGWVAPRDLESDDPVLHVWRQKDEGDVPALVVRPREEATDA